MSGADAEKVRRAANVAPAATGAAAPAPSVSGTLQPGQQGPPVRKLLKRGEEEAHMRPLQWPIMRRIMAYMWPYRWLFAIGVAGQLAWAALELVPPKLLQRAVDVNIRQGDYHGLWITAAIWAATLVVLYFCGVLIHWFLRLSGELALRDMRRDVFFKIQTLDMSYFDRTPLGRFISRGHSDIMAMTHVQVHALPAILSAVITLVGASVMMATMNWRLFLVVLGVSPVMYMVSAGFRKRARPAWRRVRRDVSRLTANVAEMVSGVRVIQAFNREEENLERFDDLSLIYWRSNMRVARFQGIYLMAVDIISITCLAIVLGWSGVAILRESTTLGVLEIGMMMAFYQYAERIFEPLRHLAPIYNQALHAMAAGERVFGLLDIEPKIHDAPGAKDLPRIEGHVKFDNVNFEYVEGQPVLRTISFDAPAGRTLALVGHTGCGKTTILSLLNRFYDVSGGAIAIDGHDLRQVTQHSLHRQTGLILQENFLFNGTIMENLKFARPEVSDEQAIEITRQLGCHEIFERLAQGYYTQVGERGENLSAGQRQLVSIGRAMVAGPRILMLDEATSSVDTQTELAIQRALERLFENRTCFIVAHRLSTVRRADQILVIDHGQIVERGTHDELIAMGGAYDRLHQQFMKVED